MQTSKDVLVISHLRTLPGMIRMQRDLDRNEKHWLGSKEEIHDM